MFVNAIIDNRCTPTTNRQVSIHTLKATSCTVITFSAHISDAKPQPTRGQAKY